MSSISMFRGFQLFVEDFSFVDPSRMTGETGHYVASGRSVGIADQPQDLSARGPVSWIRNKWKSAFAVTGHERPL